MRLRIYKRKVAALLLLLLALALAACALLALRGGQGGLRGGGGGAAAAAAAGRGGGEEEPPPPPPSVPGGLPSGLLLRAGANASSSWPPPEEEEAGEEAAAANRTLLLYRARVYRLNFDQPLLGLADGWTPPEEEEEEGGDDPPGASAAAAAAVPVALVVQVHSRAWHLRRLLASLRGALLAGAGGAGRERRLLLVLSHDVWSAELNALAAGVDFCAVLQIFFPFSRQLYPREFPGSDPRDCPRDLARAAAERRGCLNAAFPDSFGHYREAAFAQAKHHWWWKLHFVWERVRALRGHRGPVLFLEEDHLLAPDFLHVLRRLWALRPQLCPDCQVLALGSYAPLKPGTFAAQAAAQVDLRTWKSTEHNMGLVMDRQAYLQLRACTQAFCTYDDYNWDWTLQHLTVACLPRFWKVLVPQVPRVFHTGDCGMHHRRQACQPEALVARLQALLEANREHLFPPTLTLGKRFPLAPLSPHVKNGGWGDIRDHELCKSYQRLQ